MKLTKLTNKIFNISCGKKVKVNIWTIPILLFSALGGYAELFFLAYLSSLFHEFSHIFCAKLLGVGIARIEIYPFGISARLKGEYIRNSEKEFLIASSGPLFSLMLFWGITFLNRFYDSPLILFLKDTNLALCIINLLPSLPLDGGRILKSILTSRLGMLRAYKFMLKLSKFILAILIVFEVGIILLSKFNFSLVLISAFLLQNLAFEQQTISIVTLKEILYNQDKAIDAEKLITKVLCVKENTPASSILRHLSYDCFYVVNVLDKDSKIVKTLTESEVLDALLKSGVRVRYKDII